jgi:hypothetical protein
MFNHFRQPQLPQYPVGGWFFREFNVQISPTVPSQVYPKKFPKKLAANVQVFMKKGKFGTPQPVTVAGFCSKVEYLLTAS